MAAICDCRDRREYDFDMAVAAGDTARKLLSDRLCEFGAISKNGAGVNPAPNMRMLSQGERLLSVLHFDIEVLALETRTPLPSREVVVAHSTRTDCSSYGIYPDCVPILSRSFRPILRIVHRPCFAAISTLIRCVTKCFAVLRRRRG